MPNKDKGFTLVELLVVISIMALLLSILVPSLGRARAMCKRIVCLSNMRQMCVAVQKYLANNNDFFPPAALDVYGPTATETQYTWEFIRTWKKGAWHYKPGLIWEGQGNIKIQQCPSFKGPAMWAGDKYTGYSYNASYIGWVEPMGGWTPEEYIPTARITDIRKPYECAVFGDAQYGNNQANKFMRAPWENEREKDISNSTRHTGTQGFRHLKTTNVGFADGHCESRKDRHTNTYSFIQGYIGRDCGFLSEDNSLYDME
jgi:prepilin-type N-terminal cleavage/methylation domain-containing protein/prepilin-type processing-associated H-X9-DG protein